MRIERTSDMVNVVRCKDCKHGDIDPSGKVSYCLLGGLRNPNYFCADGERKDKDEQS